MYTCMHNWSKSLLLGNSAFGATSIHLCSLYIHVWITQPNSPFINHNQADNQRISDRKKLGYLLVLRSGDVGPWNFYLHREKNTHTHTSGQCLVLQLAAYTVQDINWNTADLVMYLYPLIQTPSTGLRHPSLEEGAGKRCSECATDRVSLTRIARSTTHKRDKSAKGINTCTAERK